MPGGIPSPIPRPTTGLRAGDWNTVELVLDANILRTFLNDAGGVATRSRSPNTARSVPSPSLPVGRARCASRTSRLKISSRASRVPSRCPPFQDAALNEFYYSWGPAVADFNRDGRPDIVAGPYYYLGPDYNERARSTSAARSIPARSTFNGLQYAYDFTGDGWPDVLNAIFQRPAFST